MSEGNEDRRRNVLYDQSQQLVGQFATLALRAPAILSATSIAVLLGFISTKSDLYSTHQMLIIIMITTLIIALYISSLSTLLAYRAQYFISNGLGKGETYAKYPLDASKEGNNSWIKRGLKLRLIVIFMIAVSHIFIAAGFSCFVLLLIRMEL